MPDTDLNYSPKYLGKNSIVFGGLDTIPCPRGVHRTTYVSDEVSAKCPATGQPDWYVVSISLFDPDRLPESKSLKLYLQSFRDTGVFAEKFAAVIAGELQEATKSEATEVAIEQKPRGGIRIGALARSSAVAPIEGGNKDGST